MESHRTNLFKNKGKDQDVSRRKLININFQVPLLMLKYVLFEIGNATKTNGSFSGTS